MRMKKLPNYLKAHRKRYGLSQIDLAYLLGANTDTIVWQYEHEWRSPGFINLIALEYIFGLDSKTLFAGVAAEVEKETNGRARKLATMLASRPLTPHRLRKINFLKSILSREVDYRR